MGEKIEEKKTFDGKSTRKRSEENFMIVVNIIFWVMLIGGIIGFFIGIATYEMNTVVESIVTVIASFFIKFKAEILCNISGHLSNMSDMIERSDKI